MLPSWWGWVVVALIVLATLLTWLPLIDLPLGDTNEGRILARLAIHAQNFWEKGPAGSAWATDFSPYQPVTNYAHHPPLTNLAHVAVAGTLGQDEWQLRLFGYLSGLATLVLVPALLRALQMEWGPTLLATGALAATPFFWVYGRVGGGFALVAGFAAAVAMLRRLPDPPRWAIWGTAVLAVFTVMLSWVAGLCAGLLWVWLVTARRLDRVTVPVAAGGLLGAALTATWMLQATRFGELVNAARERSDTSTFTFGEFLAEQVVHARSLLPLWLLILVIPALVAGIWDRRTRVVTGITLAVAAFWTFAPQQGAEAHTYWNYNWLLPVTIGLAALFAAAARRLPGRWKGIVGFVVVAAVVLTFVLTVTGPYQNREFVRGSAAGALASAHEPSPSPRQFFMGIDGPRWASWYWDRRVRELTPELLPEAGSKALVVVNLDRLPEWLPDDVVEVAIEQEGDYALFTVRDLRRAIAD
jgi:hypothetical protein